MPNSSASKSTLTRGYTIAFISAAILSTTAIFIRHLTQAYHLPPLVLAFWRDALVTVTLLPVLALVRPALLHLKRLHLPFLVAYGLVLAVFNVFWTLSVVLNGAAVATVLAYCSAGFTALLGWWLLKERLDWAKLLAVAFSLIGCVLVSGALSGAGWQASLPGLAVGVLTGLAYAAYSLMGRSASQRGLNPWTTLVYTFGFASLFLLAFNLLPVSGITAASTDLFWLGDALAGWAILFLLAAGPTVAGFGLYNVSLVYLPSSVANLIATLEPVFTAVTAYFLLGERLNEAQLAGSFLIVGGVAFLRIYEGWLAGQPGLQHEAGAATTD